MANRAVLRYKAERIFMQLIWHSKERQQLTVEKFQVPQRFVSGNSEGLHLQPYSAHDLGLTAFEKE
jgi:hypothetical protein